MVNAKVQDVKIEDIVALSGVNPNGCYQCGKCTGGCPLSFAMEYSPMQIVRLLQIGKINTVLDSKAIWLCTSCKICSTRCPRGLNLAGLMARLRIVAKRQGRIAQGKSQITFERTVLKSVRLRGRAYNAGILISTKFTRRTLPDALPLVIPVLRRGKIKLIPPRIRGRQQIERIFTITTGRKELE